MADITALLDRVDEAFAAFHARKISPGLAYGIVADGQLVHAGGFGGLTGADPSSGPTPHADSVFRIASMTKSFTAASLLLLRDRGLLALDDPISAHVPELRDLVLPTADSPALTIRHLMTMSGGLPTDDPWGDRQESLGFEAFSALLEGGFRFVAAPGTMFEYSNLGYAILGRAIGNVAQSSGTVPAAELTDFPEQTAYHRFVRTQVLDPMGMDATGYDTGAIPAAVLSTGYRPVGRRWEVVPPVRPGAFSAMGGLHSSVRDLSRWVIGFLDAFPARDSEPTQAHPLSRASRREMQQQSRSAWLSARLALGPPAYSPERPRAAVMATSAGYGYGLFVEQVSRLGVQVGHSGGYPGFGSHMRWHPSSGIGVIALANSTYAGPDRVARVVLDLLLREMGAPARTVSVWPDTRRAAQRIDRLLAGADGGIAGPSADELFAVNIDLDAPRPERAATWDAVESDVAVAAPDSEIALTSEGPAHATWVRTGPGGRRSTTIRLSPEPATKVQTLIVRGIPTPSAALVDAANALAGAIRTGTPWPPELSAAPQFQSAQFTFAAGAAYALSGGHVELAADALSSDGARTAEFAITAGAVDWHLTLSLADDGSVAAAGLVPQPVTSDEPLAQI
jgi:CubicO group peptidase (beta-lactamase class C family)